MQYTIGVKEPYFSLIANGQKTVEGRLYRGVFKKVKTGDIVTWKNGNKTVKTVIIGLRRYESFYCYLTCEGLSTTLPGILTVKNGEKVYRKFFSEANEKSSGVIAIELSVVE